MAAVSPPQVGVPVTRDSINAKLGAGASGLKKSTVQLADLKDWGDAYTAGDLETLYGFTAEEATLVKSALSEVPNVTAVVDALQFISKAWGA